MSLLEQGFTGSFGRPECNSAGRLALNDDRVRLRPFHVRFEVGLFPRRSAGAGVSVRSQKGRKAGSCRLTYVEDR